MRALLAFAAAAGVAMSAAAQQPQPEKPVPKDSIRITIPGCSKGTAFTVTESPEHESRSSVAPGRRFRLAGKKDVLADIKKAEGQMIEITGIIKKGQQDPTGGRVKMTPGPMSGNTSVGSNPNYEQVILDVEGFRALAADCPR
jgi:hypothetical protein